MIFNMVRLDERLAQLRGDVEELRLNHDEAKIEYEKSTAIWNFSEKIESNHTTNKNYELKAQYAMNVLEKRLKLLRTQIDIIRRISPTIANRLEDRVNYVDKTRSEQVKLFDEHFVKINNDEFDIANQIDLQRLQEIDKLAYLTENLGSRIDDIITTTTDCFIATLDYLDHE